MMFKHAESVHKQGSSLTAGFFAIALALAVFYVDTFTDIEGAVVVLYAIVLLLAAEVTGRTGIVLSGFGSFILTITSYYATHGPDPEFQTTIRLAVAVAAIVVTVVLILRNKMGQQELLASHAALKESEARYRSIFDRTRVALCERDYSRLRAHLMELKAQGVTEIGNYANAHPDFLAQCIALTSTVAANEAAYELLGTDENQPNRLGRLFVPREDQFLHVLQALLDGERYFEEKVEFHTLDGEERLVLLGISFPSDPAAFNRVVLSMVDITQRELAQKALVEAQSELTKASRAATVGALSASLAHELNQPLGAIMLNAQTVLRWLDRDPPDLSAVRRAAERIIRDNERASEIIQNTRNMLVQAKRRVESIDLTMLVRDTIALMEHELQRSSTQVRLAQNWRSPVIEGVRIELQQVIINLVTNAIQAMETSGTARAQS
ncbi:histidine kinase dimerization/phospho-acceptor domain-containing protein [Brucella sp. NM4]|uniref:sensor histidine kinase n=1 Tax=Brucella sp. NM4 TaxID=3045175 RepID=UPI0032DBD212